MRTRSFFSMALATGMFFAVAMPGSAGRAGSFGGRGFSRPSSPSPSFRTPSGPRYSAPPARPYTPPAYRPAPSPSARPSTFPVDSRSGFGKVAPGTAPRSAPQTAGDRTLNQRSAMSGAKPFKSFGDAQTAFKQKYASQYTSTFPTGEPAKRPTYIPQTYTPQGGGPSVRIFYNSSLHTYGYYPYRSTIFTPYSVFDDIAMHAAIVDSMQRNGYYYGANPYPVTTQAPAIIVNQGSRSESGAAIMKVLLYMLLAIAVLVVLYLLIRRL